LHLVAGLDDPVRGGGIPQLAGLPDGPVHQPQWRSAGQAAPSRVQPCPGRTCSMCRRWSARWARA